MNMQHAPNKDDTPQQKQVPCLTAHSLLRICLLVLTTNNISTVELLQANLVKLISSRISLSHSCMDKVHSACFVLFDAPKKKVHGKPAEVQLSSIIQTELPETTPMYANTYMECLDCEL